MPLGMLGREENMKKAPVVALHKFVRLQSFELQPFSVNFVVVLSYGGRVFNE